MIPDTFDVIEEISRQSLQVASLIHEYTQLSLASEKFPLVDRVKSNQLLLVGRIGEIQFLDLKSRIDKCRKNCSSLKESFSIRIQLDTNAQVDKISTFPFAWNDISLS